MDNRLPCVIVRSAQCYRLIDADLDGVDVKAIMARTGLRLACPVEMAPEAARELYAATTSRGAHA